MSKHRSHIDTLIKKHATTEEERHEMWKIVDEIVHHRVVGCVLDNLDKEHHQDFLEKLHNDSFEEHIELYLEKKTNREVVEKIRQEIRSIESEILSELN